jgi:hypothetical protein
MVIAMLKFIMSFTIGVPQRTTAPGSVNWPGRVLPVRISATSKTARAVSAELVRTSSDLRAMLVVTYPALGKILGS